MKKLLSLLLALTMILPLVGCAAFAENADPIMITVIATSDVHGKVLPSTTPLANLLRTWVCP